MPDNRFQGLKVSDEWDVVLTAAHKDVDFTLTSGRRTMSDQRRLYRLYRAGKGNLAAYPSPNAPHIRVGRPNHAIDVDALDGGEARLEAWLRKNGVSPTNPVRGEAWHMELSARELKRLTARLSNTGYLPILRKGSTQRTEIRILQRWLRALGFRSVTVNGKYDLKTRLAVRRWQRKNGIKPTTGTAFGPKAWRKMREQVR